MKKILSMAVAVCLLGSSIAFSSCKEKKAKLEIDKDGVEVQGKKGGEMTIDDDGLRIEGKDGGKLQIDKNGVEVEGKDKKDE